MKKTINKYNEISFALTFEEAMLHEKICERFHKLVEQNLLDGIANLHEEQALKIHKEETDAINHRKNQTKVVA